jgi:ABC-type antimicrobial peptide transport system permease subunit
MLSTFFKIAFRNILKNKIFSTINILGLSIGMAAAMLMVLWVQNELSYDQFHEKKDRVYEAWNKAEFSGELHCWNTTPKILGPTMRKDFPEVETTVRVNWQQSHLLTVGNKQLSVKGSHVDPDFFQIFSFPLVKGHSRQALDNIDEITITEHTAQSLFGDADPIGKQVKVDNAKLFTVSAVVQDLPNNTRFNFDILLPWKYLESKEGGPENNWGNNSTRTYVLLKPGVNVAGLQAKLKVLKPRYDPSEPKWQMFIYPMSRWRLHSSFENGVESGGKIILVTLFGVIAGFVLLIACINFMNLSTARSEKRAKEVGVRKVVGADKKSLVFQFIAESILISALAGILSILMLYLLLPSFNELSMKNLRLEFDNVFYWLSFLGFVLMTGFLAGSYPAFFLSAFQPVKVLKGTFRKAHAAVNPRKILVVTQFVFAITLIICTLVVRSQIQYAQDRDAGYNKNNLTYVFMEGKAYDAYPMIKNEILTNGFATSITKTSAPLTEGWSDGWGFEWEGKDPNDKTDFDRFCADDGIGKTAGFQFIAGRDLDLKSFPTDSTGLILNQSALKVMKFKNPIGQLVKDNGIEWHVVGVVKDFILQSPYYPTRPMVIEGAKGWFNVMHIKLNPQKNTAENLAGIEAIFKKFNPEFPVTIHFIDEAYAQKFEDEKRMGTLAGIFAGLTIFISCLGLFGLATFMAENRIKEIGIRKVLGASVAGIVQMLSREFLILVGIALIIACPLAGWAMKNWLQEYEYRVSLSWTVFALAGSLSFLIAILTVSFQAIKAAIANPVRSLRTE